MGVSLRLPLDEVHVELHDTKFLPSILVTRG